MPYGQCIQIEIRGDQRCGVDDDHHLPGLDGEDKEQRQATFEMLAGQGDIMKNITNLTAVMRRMIGQWQGVAHENVIPVREVALGRLAV